MGGAVMLAAAVDAVFVAAVLCCRGDRLPFFICLPFFLVNAFYALAFLVVYLSFLPDWWDFVVNFPALFQFDFDLNFLWAVFSPDLPVLTFPQYLAFGLNLFPTVVLNKARRLQAIKMTDKWLRRGAPLKKKDEDEVAPRRERQ